ncbi:hypothetical protein ACROYT_G036854 [Oculina patagonica]
MLRRIRRRFGRFFPRRWLFGLITIFAFTLIIRRVKQNGFVFELFPKTSTSKEWKATKNLALSLPARDFGRGGDRGRSRSASDENSSRYHLLKTTKLAGKAKNGEMAETIDVRTPDSFGRGSVNVHIWRGLCCPKVNSLRQYPLFPNLSKERLLRHTINSGPLGTWYGQRIMGYIHPPHTGNYTFHLDAHVYAEFWLSKKPNTIDVELIANIAKENKEKSITKPITSTSRKLYLEKGGKYFFDVLHVMNGGMMRRDHMNITWKVPGSQMYTEISSESLSPLITNEASFSDHVELLRAPRSVIDTELNDADGGEDDEDYEGITIPEIQSKLSDKFSSYFGEDFDLENRYDINNFDQLLDISEEILSVLPSCSYEPSYAKKRSFKRFEGIWQTHFSSRFPDDGTKEFICIGNKQRKDCKGNDFLTEAEVLELVQIFVKKIDEKYPRKYALKAITNIEKNHDALRGNRYFLELVFRERARSKIVKLSDFVYKFHNSSDLCRPKGITWQRNVTINVILTVKNQGAWAQHFVNEMSRICDETRDDHVNIIVVDYGSQDMNIEEALKRSSLKNYRVLKRSGTFHKTEAIQSAVSTISDPHSIVLLFDLHLRTPSNLFSAVRKHTVEGRMAFTPVLFRLTFCGRPLTSTTQPKGYWETFGFGIFSIFKSDWDRFGGMNVQDFHDKWGGEDWEMIDRVLSVGLEVERLRMPGFYHFYHSKDGMWDKSS